MSTPVRSTKPCTQFAAKRDSGVGLRTARCQPGGCLRWCGLGGMRPAHSRERVRRGPEYLVCPQGAPSVVERVALHQQLDVVGKRDAQCVGGNVCPSPRALWHTILHLDKRNSRWSSSSSGSSCRHGAHSCRSVGPQSASTPGVSDLVGPMSIQVQGNGQFVSTLTAHGHIDGTSCWSTGCAEPWQAAVRRPLRSCRLTARRLQTTVRGVLALTYLPAGRPSHESSTGGAPCHNV